MSSLSVLVVDDERPARVKVLRLLEGDPRFSIVGEARDGVDALERIATLSPDVVVLDIQMPGLDGFEVLAALGDDRRFAVVFSTAFDAHALRAFDAHAVDYLLKPYDEPRFTQAMNKAYTQCIHGAARGVRAAQSAAVSAGLPRELTRLTLKVVDGGWVTLKLSDIVLVAAADKYTRITLRGATHLVRLPLRQLAERLGERFVRTHRSQLINIHAVKRVDPWTHGDGILVLDDGSTLVLTRTYRKQFFARWAPR